MADPQVNKQFSKPTNTTAPVVEAAPAVVYATPVVDVVPAAVVEAAPVVVAAPVAVVTSTVVGMPTTWDAYVQKVMVDGTEGQKEIAFRMEEYLAKMAPNMTQHDHSGSQHQLALWGTLKAAMNKNVLEFKPCWDLVLGYFKEHRAGTMSDMYVARFFSAINLSDVEIKAFQHTLDLCALTCDPATRSITLRQINLNAVTAVGMTEQAKANIISYYA